MTVPTRLADLDAPRRRRELARSVLRVLLTWTVLTVGYFAVPTRAPRDGATIVVTVVGTSVFLALLGWQLRRILRAELPELRAVEAVGSLTAVFLVVVASTYWTMSAVDPANFSEPLTRVSAMYLTVATATTVGFGDVAALSDAARAIVTVQMLLDVILLAVLVRAIFRVARVSLRTERQLDAGE
ncbi:ion channel [Isoptericola sp. b490]|uniref:potassium channel family protein n=1 Tax=Actinotalea lenta TaxID=3064654 RepID=UPI002713BF55|nr:potassium channel family protein [Isoptericola sp. b490]MDO8122136.1 ion channel [Isoptericola sp. b490]